MYIESPNVGPLMTQHFFQVSGGGACIEVTLCIAQVVMHRNLPIHGLSYHCSEMLSHLFFCVFYMNTTYPFILQIGPSEYWTSLQY